mgnify:CR=1 FL=1|tara:strand:- start:422 stop:613 length:192 start_codon:yes stop_codon:yes gene_type:complete
MNLRDGEKLKTAQDKDAENVMEIHVVKQPNRRNIHPTRARMNLSTVTKRFAKGFTKQDDLSSE